VTTHGRPTPDNVPERRPQQRPDDPPDFLADVTMLPMEQAVAGGARRIGSSFRTPLKFAWEPNPRARYDCALWFESIEILHPGETARAGFWLTWPEYVLPRLNVGETFELAISAPIACATVISVRR